MKRDPNEPIWKIAGDTYAAACFMRPNGHRLVLGFFIAEPLTPQQLETPINIRLHIPCLSGIVKATSNTAARDGTRMRVEFASVGPIGRQIIGSEKHTHPAGDVRKLAPQRRTVPAWPQN